MSVEIKLLLACFFPVHLLSGQILYETDFDDFPVGPNQWTRPAEWESNDNSSGAQSIDDDVLPALLNTATLGFARPQNTFTTVFLDLGFDPANAPSPIVEIDTLIGIEDSSNDFRDQFYLTLYNSSGDRLAAILFDNSNDPDEFGIWRENSNTSFDTSYDFIPGELFNLFATIDFESNTWSADIDGIPLFERAPFTNNSGPLDLGFLAFEWDLDSSLTFFHGNNFLLVADLFIRNVESAPVPVTFLTIDQGGAPALTWTTAVGWADQVQFSTDLITWQDTLPDSTYDNISVPSTVTYRDTSSGRGITRFYRILRTPDL